VHMRVYLFFWLAKLGYIWRAERIVTTITIPFCSCVFLSFSILAHWIDIGQMIGKSPAREEAVGA
jgi:hypothetical protein